MFLVSLAPEVLKQVLWGKVYLLYIPFNQLTQKGKLARSVNAAIGSEMEQREKERAGTDRMMNAKMITFEIMDDTLRVSYKLGRKAVEEVHSHKSWEETKAELLLGLDGEKLDSVLELATEHPAYYWLVFYHNKGKPLEEVLGEAGITSVGKRRRRV